MHADVAVDAHRPEVRVLGPVEAVETHARRRGAELQIERGRLDRLLLGAGEPGEAVGKGVGDAEIHRVYHLTPNTFITSSPR